MRNVLGILFLTALLFLQGCSNLVERYPAQAGDDVFNQIFSFMPSGEEVGDQEQNTRASFPNDIGPKNPIYEFIKTKELTGNAAFHVELGIHPKTGKAIFRTFYVPDAFKDSLAVKDLSKFLSKISHQVFYGAPHGIFEIYYNAREGDPVALNTFFRLRTQGWIPEINSFLAIPDNSGDYSHARRTLKDAGEEIKEALKDLKGKKAKAKAKRRTLLDKLDKAPEGKQFRDFVAKNDRLGAAGVLKKYLPWEEMPPFEKKFWGTYLEVMVNPVPLDQRVFIYRGLEEDYVNRAIVGGKLLSEKEAILQGKAFFMSSMLVKNQGSWNRRLRSMESMYGKELTAGFSGSHEYTQSARISTVFNAHSGEPLGSPFLSLTPNFKIAKSFGEARVAAYLIDPRLLNYNISSSLSHEAEFLIPLTTFPDELVAIADEALSDIGIHQERKDYLEEKLGELIENEYGKSNKKDVLRKIKANSYHFFKDAFPGMKKAQNPGSGAANLSFYEKFLTKDEPKPVMSKTGELSCQNLISLFWMNK